MQKLKFDFILINNIWRYLECLSSEQSYKILNFACICEILELIGINKS